MTKPRVLFLYNGGTIGQVIEEHGGSKILVPPKNAYVFEKACTQVLEAFGKRIKIDFEIITTKDSSNMSPNDWEKLIFRIKKAQDEEKYDAVGIAHGTDTMSFTAVALAFGLNGSNPNKSWLRIPIAITGSQTPIYQEGGDGRFNLENLFRVLEEAIKLGVADVLINFWDRVFLGCRSMKKSEKDFDAFYSPAFPEVGIIDAKGVTLNTRLLKKGGNSRGASIAPKFGKGVVSLELNPGIEPSIIKNFVTSGGISAIILKSLGEGNVCSEGDYNMLPLIKQVTGEYKVPLFITTKFAGGNASSTQYETGVEAIKAGAIPCYDHTDIAVDVKMRWLIGNGICSKIQDFKKAMRTNYAGEVTEPKE